MNAFLKRALSLMLCAVLVAGFLLIQLPKTQAAHYTGYNTVAVVYNQGDCYSMQGCDSDDTYIYCTKINTETETSAVIARVHKDTGATTFLTNSATGTYYFSQLSHANDLDVVDITAKEFIKELIGMGIPCSGILWPESYLEQAYQEGVGFGTAQFPFKSKEYTDAKSVDYSKVVCPVAKSLRDQTVSLFLHPSWEKCHIEKVIEGIKTVIANHSK